MAIFFTKSQNIYKKPKCYFGNILQKNPILFWKHFTKKSNATSATFYQKPKTIGQTISLSKPKYYFAKVLYYAQSPKLTFGNDDTQKNQYTECSGF